MGEFFAPRFGGTPKAWGDANAAVIQGIWRDWQVELQRGADLPIDWFAQQDPRWLFGMCERVGVALPADVAGTVRASKAYVMAQVDCAFPDAAPTVQALHERGLTLHTASGGQSHELASYLDRMGIRASFDRLYGPDLIGVHKSSPRYYERIAQDAGVDPAAAIVVDDHAEPLEWAAASGFRTVHLDRQGTGSRFTRIESLEQLLPLLDRDQLRGR